MTENESTRLLRFYSTGTVLASASIKNAVRQAKTSGEKLGMAYDGADYVEPLIMMRQRTTAGSFPPSAINSNFDFHAADDWFTLKFGTAAATTAGEPNAATVGKGNFYVKRRTTKSGTPDKDKYFKADANQHTDLQIVVTMLSPPPMWLQQHKGMLRMVTEVSSNTVANTWPCEGPDASLCASLSSSP